MKILPCIAAIFLATLTPGVNSDPGWGPPTRISTCSHPGFFVNSHDCSRFFRCVDHSTSEGPHFVRYDFDCPPGTTFDENAQTCVHARDGICGGWSPPHVHGWAPPPPLVKKGWGPPPPLIVREAWPAPPPPPKAGWTTVKVVKRPQKLGWGKAAPAIHVLPHYHEIEEEFDQGWGQPSEPSSSFWSFTPHNSYVVVYDDHIRNKRKSSKELP